jgi:hypothetical protein
MSSNFMEEEEINTYKEIFPFEFWSLDTKLKYLGFHLKPNNYKKHDWNWIVIKLEKRLKSWSFHWLSRARKVGFSKVCTRSNSDILDVISLDSEGHARKC